MRVKRSVGAHKAKRKIFNLAKGYQGGRRRLLKTATETVHRALAYSYRDRRVRARMFRQLWIIRINAAARMCGLTYRALMHKMKTNQVALNRKLLADMAARDMESFTKLVQSLK